MKERIASFLVPVLLALALLYQVLGSLQIAVTNKATLVVIGVTVGLAVVAGLLAALGPMVLRVAVLAACALIFLDVTLHFSPLFERLRPERRAAAVRDDQRIRDIHRIKSALDQYLQRVGPLPTPAEYGEATGPDTFWKDWWDVSSRDENKNGKPFLEFLVAAGILPSVPVDPINRAPNSDPRSGTQYAFLLLPPAQPFGGGACDAGPNRWHYVLAITDLEDEPLRPPARAKGSGCKCLWRDQPDFFQEQFDYVVCGSFEATEESRARVAATRAMEDPAAAARDEQRVRDIQTIQTAIEQYVKRIGPVPTPEQYGEATGPDTFWKDWWDVSSRDENKNGKPFLDFLVDDGILRSVPVDPANTAPDADPRSGRQYVFYVVPPMYAYAGGACDMRANRWHYVLAVTDLERETARPPRLVQGSGCACLWSKQPNFFQQHFDYVVCGSFDATPESLARAAARRARRDPATAARDARRIKDIQQIKKALDEYLERVGPIPSPAMYGEQTGPANYWKDFWDLSTHDGDGDRKLFMDFLVESKVLKSVPVDPVNTTPNADPRSGMQYAFYVVPPSYDYAGGTCAPNRWHYMLAITDLERESTRPPVTVKGSGCDCLWRDAPNFFQPQFDYIVCGVFDSLPKAEPPPTETSTTGTEAPAATATTSTQ